MRALIPGQIAWDNARSSWANGNKTNAAIYATGMIGEVALAVGTAGYTNSAKQVGINATERTIGKNTANLSEETLVKEALERARHNSDIAQRYMERYRDVIRATKAKGKFNAGLEHLPRLEDFVANPTVRGGMESMSPEIIRAQQIAHVQSLEGDIYRNLSQAYEIVEKYLK